MADYTNIIPQLLSEEGGYVVDQGGKTNKGITYSTWQLYFGDTPDRFIAMSDADWSTIFKSEYWDKIHGDAIQDQAVADFLVDWVFNSGSYGIGHVFTSGNMYGVQVVLNTVFGKSLSIDGNLGAFTLAAINGVNPTDLLNALRANRENFFRYIATFNPQNAADLTGWLNRLNSLYASVSQYVGDTVTTAANTITANPIKTAVVTLFFCLLQYMP